MNSTARDFVSVDMHGMKAALVARARDRGVAVSAIVRAAVARELELARPPHACDEPGASGVGSARREVKVSFRLSPAEALQLAQRAREAGLSRNAYVGGLIAGATIIRTRQDHVAALTASCAELSTLSRNIDHLATLLRLASHRAAEPYVEMLRSLRQEVRRHLELAASVLAHLHPPSARGSSRDRKGAGLSDG